MPAFPKLKTGAVAQYPFATQYRSRTDIVRFLDGTEQTLYIGEDGLIRRHDYDSASGRGTGTTVPIPLPAHPISWGGTQVRVAFLPFGHDLRAPATV